MAVVRLKRPLNNDPVDTLLLACKRRKTEDEHLTSIFKFAATVSDQEENVAKHLTKVIQSPEVHFKTPNLSNITNKLRAEKKLFSQNSRLKVVNCFRALNELDYLEEDSSPSCSDRLLTIVEIESLPLVTSKGTSAQEEKPNGDSEQFVYDLYYAPNCKLDENMLNNPMSCHILEELLVEDSRDDVYNDEEYSSDSNDENNWRNDYPDEDPDSINENDMKLACHLGGLNLTGDNNSLSSDDGEEDLIYGKDDSDFHLQGLNGQYYQSGKDFAAYKKRVTRDLDSGASDNSDFSYSYIDVYSEHSDSDS